MLGITGKWSVADGDKICGRYQFGRATQVYERQATR